MRSSLVFEVLTCKVCFHTQVLTCHRKHTHSHSHTHSHTHTHTHTHTYTYFRCQVSTCDETPANGDSTIGAFLGYFCLLIALLHLGNKAVKHLITFIASPLSDDGAVSFHSTQAEFQVASRRSFRMTGVLRSATTIGT